MVSEQTGLAEFVSVVDEIRREAASAVYEPRAPEADYLLDGARLDEAAGVAPCVARFAIAEILPEDGRRPVGRHTPGALSLSPSLGHLLKKRLSRRDTEPTAALRDVVMDAVAFAYVAAVDAEAAHIKAGGDPAAVAVRMDRSTEQIWNYWVVSFAGDPEAAFDVRFRRNIQDACFQRVTSGLRQLDLLPPIGRRTKLRGTAGTYASAGLVLRLSQSNNVTDESFAGTWRLATNMWPYEEYVE
jgi:hypothetical protein